jgi:hypothetical protein
MSSSMTAAVKSLPSASSATTPKKPTSSANVIQNNASPPQTSSTTPTVVPLSQDVASQGLLAVGGCRQVKFGDNNHIQMQLPIHPIQFQCSKTFTDRLSLIHHFVDHFPNIFYSFEESQSPTRPQQPQQFSGKAPPTSTPEPGNGKHNNNVAAGFGQQIGGGGGIAPDAGTSPAEGELLGHLADLFGTNLANSRFHPKICLFQEWLVEHTTPVVPIQWAQRRRWSRCSAQTSCNK